MGLGAPGSGVWYLGLGVELGISDSRDLSGHAKLKPRRLSLSTSKIDLLKKRVSLYARTTSVPTDSYLLYIS